MGKEARHENRWVVAAGMALMITAVSGMGSPILAEEGRWTLRYTPALTAVEGHDQHVLTIHEIDDGPPFVDTKSVVTIDTGRKMTYGFELQNDGETWGYGVRFFLYGAPAEKIHRTAAADGPSGVLDEVVFEIADEQYVSQDPGEVLFYDLLADNRLEVWTFDLYGTRVVARTDNGAFRVQLGLRVGDFDNDYRSVVGLEDVEGTRVDASSNYPAMMGPLVGLIGDARRGHHEFRGYIGQSVLLGEASLRRNARHFTGPFSAASFDAVESFGTTQDVAIPVTEIRADWTYRIGRHIGVGLGASVSAWFDVPVPPGVVPVPGGDEALHENTVVFTGMTGAFEWRF